MLCIHLVLLYYVPHTGMAPSNLLVPGMDSAVVFRQEPSSGQGNAGYLLDTSIHSQESGPRVNHTRTHLGGSYNRVSSTTSMLSDNHKGTAYYPRQNPPLSTQGASWKMSEF